LAASVVARHENPAFRDIFDIAIAAYMLLASGLAAVALFVGDVLHLVVWDAEAWFAGHDGAGLCTALFTSHAHMVDLEIIDHPALTAIHEGTARLAAQGIGVAHPKGSFLRCLPQHSALVGCTGLCTARLLSQIHTFHRGGCHAEAFLALKAVAILVTANFGTRSYIVGIGWVFFMA